MTAPGVAILKLSQFLRKITDPEQRDRAECWLIAILDRLFICEQEKAMLEAALLKIKNDKIAALTTERDALVVERDALKSQIPAAGTVKDAADVAAEAGDPDLAAAQAAVDAAKAAQPA